MLIVVRNLTSHDVVVVDSNGNERIFPSCGLARVEVKQELIWEIDGIPVKRNHYGEVIGLPPQNGNNFYIVSALVAQHTNRDDIIVPNDFIRDGNGRIIGCSSFGVI